MDMDTATAADIARSVANRKVSSRQVIEAALSRIEAVDRLVNAFTDVTAARARAAADKLDSRIAAGASPGALAGVPFAVKNLIDLEGIPTRAGSLINRERPPARRDGALVRRLEDAGAICVGALNMGEYAYDFTGENIHDGPSRNPHDTARMSGGSSGGSGAAVAAGLVPFSLGSDTNGSIRVPSSFCGLFGLKPTYGRLTRAGSFPFVGSLDHLGPLARTVTDLALAYDAMTGPDAEDSATTETPPDAVLSHLNDGLGSLRIAVAGGYFARGADAVAAVELVAKAVGCRTIATIDDAARARAAAYVITAAEGASLHLDRLRNRAVDFDPAVRDRLMAGAMTPAAWVDRAQRFRRVFHRQVLTLFEDIDIILAPATPCRALPIGQKRFEFGGETLNARANIGLFTQPISFIGLPVVAVPVWLDEGLPIGVQIIAPPWREAYALRVAYQLQREGIASAPVSNLCGRSE